MRTLTPLTTPLHILSLAEVGNTASADHLLQMATMPLEHKTTALFFFARVGALCAPRGTSHRVEFV